MNRETRLQVAKALTESRYVSGKSQEWMSFEIGVSKKTIQNWEKGISAPDISQFFEWFNALKINPAGKLMSLLYNNEKSNIDVNNAFTALCEGLSTEDKEAILFLFNGNHGSSAHSLLQMLLAHTHTPLSTRVTQADAIYNAYDFHRELGTLICTDDTLPDIEDLEKARKLGRMAVMRNEYGYTFLEKNTPTC